MSAKSKMFQFFKGTAYSQGSYKISSAEITERCVLCSCDTGILKETPVSQREHYISGCGQLCDDCYYQVVHQAE